MTHCHNDRFLWQKVSVLSVALFVFYSNCLLATHSADIAGLGAKETGMAQSGLISMPGAQSARGNPSLLPWSGRLFALDTHGQVAKLLDNSIQGSTSAPSSGLSIDTHKASTVRPTHFFGLGLSFPLGPKISVGLSGKFPLEDAAKVHSFTVNESNYLHFNDRQILPEIFTGVGFKVSEQFSLGAGLYYSMKATGTMQLGISQTDAESRMFLNLTPTFIPYFGLGYKLWDQADQSFILGTTYKMEQKAKTKLNIDVDFDVGLGTIPFSTNTELIPFYSPAVWALGATFHHRALTYSLAYEYSWWSNYTPPVISLSGKDLDTLNSGKTLSRAINLHDTHSVRTGWQWSEAFSLFQCPVDLRMGLEYHTSAVEKDTDNITVVDNTRYGPSFGAGLKLPQWTSFITSPIQANIAFKYLHLQKEVFSDQLKGQNRHNHSGGNVYNVLLGVQFEI